MTLTPAELEAVKLLGAVPPARLLEALGYEVRPGTITEQRVGEWRAYPLGTVVAQAVGGPCLVVLL